MDSSCQKIQPILQSLESPIFWPFSTKKTRQRSMQFLPGCKLKLNPFLGQQALKIKSCLGIIFFSKKSLRNNLYRGSVISNNNKLFATSFHEKRTLNFCEFSNQLDCLFVFFRQNNLIGLKSSEIS